MTEKVAPWTLTIASDLRMLATARGFIEAVCQAAGFDEPTVHSIVLAADEAVNNVIRHAHQGRPDAVVQIQCFLHPDAIEIRLIDQGEPFDIAAVPHLDPGEVRVGGRGVFLMRSLMDELSCQPRGEGGNTLRMVKCRDPRRKARRRPRLTVQHGRRAFLSPPVRPLSPSRRLPSVSSFHPSRPKRWASRAQLAPAPRRPQRRAKDRPNFPDACPASRRYSE